MEVEDNMMCSSVLACLPKRLVNKLMEFQKEGIEFAISKNGRVLIADEMGLGKTIQAIAVAYYYRAEWPLLIVVPSSLRYCWIEELEKWLPDIHPHEINLIQMGNDAKSISSSKISIVTYGLLSKSTSHIVKEALSNQKFHVVICDESHYIRNSRTASAKAVVPLVQAAERRILLSGTPALAKPVELFPQLDALCPNVFGTWWEFTARYCDPKIEWFGKMKRRKVDGASNLEELQTRLVNNVMIRREKKEVLTQLPEKQRQKVLFELKDSDLKKDIRTTFDDLKPKMKQGNLPIVPTEEEMDTPSLENNKEDKSSLGLISKLLQLTGEAKVGPVKEYISMLVENQNLKFLVFAYHHVMMNGVQQTLYDKKIKFIRIDGTVSPADRQMYVQQFQSDPDTKVAILSILAAGVGLTLTAAKLVVFAEMYWTPGVMVQCEDRAHRIGQTSCVPVHYLVAKGTMDEWVWSAVCKKTVVTSATLNGKREKLEARAGDKYQVEILSKADVYCPEDNTDMDVTSYFQSQRPNDQKSILDFFTPPCKTKADDEKSRNHKRKLSYDCHLDGSKKPKIMNSDIITWDSDSESEDFVKQTPRKIRTKLFDILGRDIKSPKPFQKSPKSDSKIPSDNSSSTKSSQWNCPRCTFINYHELPYCEMCECPKPKKSRIQKMHPEVEGKNDELTSVHTCNDGLNASSDAKNQSHCVDKINDFEDNSSCLLKDVISEDFVNAETTENSPSQTLTPSSQQLRADIHMSSASHLHSISLNPTHSSNKLLFKRTPKPDEKQLEDIKVQEEMINHTPSSSSSRSEMKYRESPSVSTTNSSPLLAKNTDVQPPANVYKSFVYCCSKYTGRVYIFDENEEPLNVNFLPLDIEVDNMDNLPDILLYPPHLRLVQKFVREWNLLTDTKKRIVVNRGLLFTNPLAAYQQISSKNTSSTQRHKTKEDISLAAVKLASSINGSVRQIAKRATDSINVKDNHGIAQVINNEGVPLCVNCEQPYINKLLTDETITSVNSAWQTRFCSPACAHSHWTKTDSGYCRDKLYEIEHGVCQMCQFDAHSFYKQLRDTIDVKQRVKLLSESKFSKLKSKVKEQMTRKPVEGQFWHVDHIKPVWEGGGMCDLDNMRTLCVICHHQVTAQQATKRAHVRRLSSAASSADITAFFKKM